MTFTPETSVADLAAREPATIAVFQKHGIDFCCGGKRPIGDVCAERNISYDALAGELGSATAPATPVRLRWDARPLRELTTHIVESFHDPLSVELPRLVAMAHRVAERHGSSSQPFAAAIAATLETFALDMAIHTRHEEAEMFPLAERLEAGAATAADAERFLVGQVGLESDHRQAGRALTTLRELSNHYRAPEGACPTTVGLYHGLGELESLMTLHVHLENNILFPRAQALAVAACEAGRS
jgi:regulator of cell morphogenesis and NO signaling